MPVPNSLLLAERIPGAWLVQIHGGGHGALWRYPDEFGSVTDISYNYSGPHRMKRKLILLLTILKFKEDPYIKIEKNPHAAFYICQRVTYNNQSCTQTT
jgi:hypothetical protein